HQMRPVCQNLVAIGRSRLGPHGILAVQRKLRDRHTPGDVAISRVIEAHTFAVLRRAEQLYGFRLLGQWQLLPLGCHCQPAHHGGHCRTAKCHYSSLGFGLHWLAPGITRGLTVPYSSTKSPGRRAVFVPVLSEAPAYVKKYRVM